MIAATFIKQTAEEPAVIELVYAHSTASMVVGYLVEAGGGTHSGKCNVNVSRLRDEAVGKTMCYQGSRIHLPKRPPAAHPPHTTNLP